MGKIPKTIRVNEELWAKLKASGINISAFIDQQLRNKFANSRLLKIKKALSCCYFCEKNFVLKGGFFGGLHTDEGYYRVSCCPECYYSIITDKKYDKYRSTFLSNSDQPFPAPEDDSTKSIIKNKVANHFILQSIIKYPLFDGAQLIKLLDLCEDKNYVGFNFQPQMFLSPEYIEMARIYGFDVSGNEIDEEILAEEMREESEATE